LSRLYEKIEKLEKLREEDRAEIDDNLSFIE